jgi:phage gp36-like protein
MSYATLTSVRTALAAGGVIDPTNAGSLADADLQDAIDEADALIDGYLTARYALPIAGDVPPIVKMVSRDLAASYATITYLGSIPLLPTHPVQIKAASAMATLEKIRTGDVMLSLPGAGSQQRTDNPAVENLYEGNMFTLEQFDLTRDWRNC